MFDDLNDPDPPVADVAMLNQVAKRADRLRRRRALILGIGAGVLVVAATIAAIAIASGDDTEGRLVVDVSPSASPVTTVPDTASTLFSTSTTTDSVVVPPTATTAAPVTTDTVEVVETTIVDTTVAPETTTTLPATTTTVAPPLGPIAAIDANGDAVIVALDGANTVLFDGPDPDDPPAGEGETSGVDGLAVTPDRSRAYIGLCCEPVAGTLLQAAPPAMASTDGATVFGHAPAMAPGGGLLGRIVYDTLVVSDLAVNELAAVPEDFDVGTTYDLQWADDSHLLALRLGPAGTDLRVFNFAGNTLTPAASANVIPAGSPGVTFAGRSAGVIYLLGTTPGALTAYDSTTLAPLPDRNIAVVGAVSAWVDGGAVRWVDGARQLHVGDAVVPGQYLWVR